MQRGPEVDVAQQYAQALRELTFNSKPLITSLTMIAGENQHACQQIVRVIEARTRQSSAEQALPVLYLLDSIVKTYREPYLSAFAANLVPTFCSVYERADAPQRALLYKLLQTWRGLYSDSLLQQLLARIDRVHRPPPGSHVSPRFVAQQQHTPPPPPAPANSAALDALVAQVLALPPAVQQQVFGALPPEQQGQLLQAILALAAAPPPQPPPLIPPSSLPLPAPAPPPPQDTSAATLEALLGSLPPNMLAALLGGGSAPVPPAPGAGLLPLPSAPAPAPPAPELPLPLPLPLPPAGAAGLLPLPLPLPVAPAVAPVLAAPVPPVAPLAAVPPPAAAPGAAVGLAAAGDRGALDAIVAGLYSDQPVQCVQCAMRFREKERLDRHLDWHFRQNRALRQKKMQSRAWYLGAADWAKLDPQAQPSEQADADAAAAANPFAVAATAAQAQAAATAAAESGSGEAIRASEAPEGARCPVCGEAFEEVWDARCEDWCLKDAVRRPGGLYHPACAASVPAKRTDEVPHDTDPPAKRPRATT